MKVNWIQVYVFLLFFFIHSKKKYKELRINSCNHYITKMKEFGPNFSLYREKKAVGAEQEVFQKFPNSDAQVSVVDADGTTTSAEKALQTELYPHKFVRNPTGKAVKESEEHLKLFLEEFAPLTNGETSNQLVTITGRITCKYVFTFLPPPIHSD